MSTRICGILRYWIYTLTRKNQTIKRGAPVHTSFCSDCCTEPCTYAHGQTWTQRHPS